MRRRLATAVLALLAAPAAARAQNLVTNPSFEDGPAGFGAAPTGYTLTFADDGGGAGRFNSAPRAHSGSGVFLFADPAAASATLAQTLATAPGTSYRIGFLAFNLAGLRPVNRLTVAFGGVTVFDAILTNGAYQEFTAEGVATDTATTLAFTGSNLTSLTYLDDLRVTAVGPVSTVPEPATWALMGTGLVALGVVVRRRTA